ncbi:TBC1 domain family member 1-like isoform X1 [Rhopilema esculentum]|uniref:TBC1 domain family member 1-like isoform X1 n=2 Tax=Rhopilema esculentum TaxID=499914 RepID=UPI0031E04F3C
MANRPEPPRLNIEISDNEEISDPVLKNYSKFSLTYLGNTFVDRRYTPAIIQWVVREVLQSQANQPREVDFIIKATRIDIATKEEEGTIANHDFSSIVKLPRLKNQAKILAFVVSGRIESDKCCCHVFCCATQETKLTILQELKAKILEAQSESNQESSPPRKSLHTAQAPKMTHRRNLSYCGAISQAEDDFVQRFSVFYVGKVTISQAQAPPKFVDEMLRQIKLLEVESKKHKKNGHHERSPEKITGNTKHSSSGKIIDIHSNDHPSTNPSEHTSRLRSASDGDKRLPTSLQQEKKDCQLPGEENNMKNKGCDLNDDVSLRVVKFQVSMSSLMLFSAGNKQLLLEKKIREISYCTKGQQRTDHFGFICREKKNHLLYLFQGESEHMVDMIMKAMKQAFSDALQASAHLSLCEACPIQNLIRLCAKVEASSLSEQQAAVQEHIQSLNEAEYHYVMNKFNASRPDGDSEKITLLVCLLRAVYDQRQKLHKHNLPGMSLNAPTQTHTFDETRDRSRSTFFEKAKKSLTNSFDNLIMRRQRARTCLNTDTPLSVDTTNNGKLTSDNKRCLSPNLPRASSEEHVNERQRSRTFNSCPPTPDYQSTSQTRFVIPESDAETKAESNNDREKEAVVKDEPEEKTGIKKKPFGRQGSWRQQIYNTVTVDVSINEEKKEDSSSLAKARWRKAIMEQILLIRMERENQNLETKISATETRREKLSYEVYEHCSAEAAKTWDEILAKNWKEKVDDQLLMAAVKSGVPKYRRGEVWKFLAQQHAIRAPKKDEDQRNSKSYEELLEQPTTHQHAILIDIGRTFPSHAYFNVSLGAGQIGLFNTLKSYSLLDDEVGYCQGLSFVAGLLLMHMSEKEAFDLFKYVMFNIGIRSQYKPDMNAVQQQLYQLSRLLHDVHPNIYEHFNTHDVTPTLYAAPWFLTLFASHYPIGFVVRVMDLLFLQGLEVVFKIGLGLFANSCTDILECDGFETIIDYMKNGLPETVKTDSQELIAKALDMDIKYQLNLFEVEYQLLHEEMIDIRQNRERYEKLEAANKELAQQVNDLKCELDYAKESAEAMRKELLETREHLRNTDVLSTQNQELMFRVALLEDELKSLGSKGGYKHVEETDGASMSPASSEVDGIMLSGLEKKYCIETQSSVEKSWELVPSPATVSQEMIRNSPGSNRSINGAISKEDLESSEEAKERHPILINCKSSSAESYESDDLICFDDSTACGLSSGVNKVLSSSEESLLDENTDQKACSKSPLKKKRPALPVIHTTGLLATCKDPEMISKE